MSNILEVVKHKIDKDLLTIPDVADILKLTRERIRQLVVSKVLPPRYIFNQNSNRKQYIFDRYTIEEYSINGVVKWNECENINLLSIPEINNILVCPIRWIYDMTRKQKLIPVKVIGNSETNLLCLYDLRDVQTLWNNKDKRGSNKGYRKSTINLLHDIKVLNEQGFNDSEIAKKLNKKQSFISKLRKDSGLVSLCKRGRPIRSSDNIEYSNNIGSNVTVLDTVDYELT